MPKTNGYVKRDSKTGESTVRLNRDVTALLDIYCKYTNQTKQTVVNREVKRILNVYFEKLREAADD